MHAPVDRRRAARKWLLVAVAGALYLWLADDGRHHWHEYRYLYSAAYYRLGDLVAGAFDATPPPVKSRAVTGSWYWGQLGHEALLRALVRTFGRGAVAHTAILWCYAALTLLGVGAAVRLLRLLPLQLDVTATGLVLLYFPLTVYLGFKLLAEVPAFTCGVLACLLWVLALRAERRGRAAIFSAAAGLALAGSLLCMVYVPLMFAGLVLAAWGTLGSTLGGTRRIAATTGVVLAVAGSVLALVWAPFGLTLRDYLWMYEVYHREYGKPLAASVFLLGMSGSGLYLAAAASLLSPRVAERRFLAVWAGAALLPIIVFSGNFLDTRYATVALVPMAGLAVLGVEAIGSRIRRRPTPFTPRGLRICAAATALLITVVTAPLMPFEIDVDDLGQIVARVWSAFPTARILVTSNYSDFHFLRFAYPERPVYLVETPRDDDGRLVRDSAWEARRRATYGETFVDDMQGLRSVARGGPLVYVGYGRLPTLDRLQRLSARYGISPVSRALERMKPRNHLAESWMWGDPRFAFRPWAEIGQYFAYLVTVRDAPDTTRR